MTENSNATPTTQELLKQESNATAPVESASKSKKRMSRAHLALMPGFTWNPLRKLPRNMSCPCLSGKKFKVCCLNTLLPVVKAEDAKQYEEQMSREFLVFATKDNEDKVRAFYKSKGIILGGKDVASECESDQPAD